MKISFGPVIFVVQVMCDISKQDCIPNKRIPQCTRNENLHSSSITVMTSRNHQLTLISGKAGSKKTQFMKILIHIG